MEKRVFRAGTGVFGDGTPKICVPIVETEREKIWKKAEEIAALPVDIVEWRADFYEDISEPEKTAAVLKGMKERLKEKAVLFTFRTTGEGGRREIHKDTYYRMNELAACAGADLVDIEAYLEEERTAEEIERIRQAGSRVIASNHDFARTPDVEEMVRRLCRMEELGADAAKLAVMPLEKQDVLNLLQATLEADRMLQIPVVTMSMGNLGVCSRICGRLTGSAMTFASVGEGSAPGQIPAEQMLDFLQFLK